MKIKKYIEETRKIIKEIEDAEQNIANVFSELKIVESKYMKKEISYNKFDSLNKKILSNKSKEEVLVKYKQYHTFLINKLQVLNSKIFNQIYNDKSYETLKIGKQKKTEKKTRLLPELSSLEIAQYEIPIQPVEIIEKPEPVIIKPEPVKEVIEVKTEEPKIQVAPPKPRSLEFRNIPKPVKLNFSQRLKLILSSKQKPWVSDDKNIAFGGIFSKEFLEYLFKGKEQKDDVFGKTTISQSILSYELKSGAKKEVTRSDVLDPYLLEKQIKELKNLISKKKPEVYKASSIGYLANLSVRKISIYFIEKYPEFFKKVYTAVRYANLRILANTYINIVFFLGILVTLISLPVFTMFFAFQGGSFFAVIGKALGTVIGICAFTFWAGFYYPNMKADTRKRSINSNLPFAIDHMSSVISSGVSPATMFKLISHSKEYGEISIEIEKVTNYITFFGYDILTALKAVGITTPSQSFKEFIDGFVSTIETGGDLKDYLKQKSSEALLNYKLERQKYVESLGTYSDIYTGVLIAAPLFFVTALSLVSVLGGTIGGMSVNTIITLGTYLVIPGLNLLFLIFLELNQPEI